MNEEYLLYKDILHIYYSGYPETLPQSIQSKYIVKGRYNQLKTKITYILRYIIEYLKSWKKGLLLNQNQEVLSNKIWIFVNTKNQYDALKEISIHLKEFVWISRGFKSKENTFYHLLSLYRLLYNWKYFVIKKHFKRKYSDKLFNAVGQYDAYYLILKRIQPRAIVFSSDHSIDGRSLMHAANELNIPTIYTQHASVSKYFPPLCYTMSLLEGQDSLDKYKCIGEIQGIVKLIGSPKLNSLKYKRNIKSKVESIGVCFSLADDLEKVQNFMNQISLRYPEINLSLRPHPRETRVIKFPKDINLTFSNSKKEDVIEYLLQQDLIIAGESSIHLEATILNIISLHYSFNSGGDFYDYYGYVRHNMIESFSNTDSILDKIGDYRNHKPNVYKRASYFNAFVQTESTENVGEIAANSILQILA